MEMMQSDHGLEREKMQRFKRFVRLNTGNMAMALICLLYFCSAFLTLSHSQDITIVPTG